jgi:signal-transduction protein with cAMP-binding, CBS, and nucleotidyltransferase domain
VERLRRGETPDDFIDPKTLNPLARSYLKEAFRAVASVQSGLAAELATGIRWGLNPCDRRCHEPTAN